MNWINRKNNNYQRSDSDISIHTIVIRNKSYIDFIFRNDVWKFFESPDLRLEMAVENNRIYFRSSKYGMKLSLGSSACSNRYMKYPVNKYTQSIADKFVGDYDLKFDETEKLYYISLDARW